MLGKEARERLGRAVEQERRLRQGVERLRREAIGEGLREGLEAGVERLQLGGVGAALSHGGRGA